MLVDGADEECPDPDKENGEKNSVCEDMATQILHLARLRPMIQLWEILGIWIPCGDLQTLTTLSTTGEEFRADKQNRIGRFFPMIDHRDPTMLDEFTRGIKTLTRLSVWLLVSGCSAHGVPEPGNSFMQSVFQGRWLELLSRFFGN